MTDLDRMHTFIMLRKCFYGYCVSKTRLKFSSFFGGVGINIRQVLFETRSQPRERFFSQIFIMPSIISISWATVKRENLIWFVKVLMANLLFELMKL